MKQKIKFTVLFLSVCCMMTSITRLNAQSYPRWDNTPDKDIPSATAKVDPGVGLGCFGFGVGNGYDVYYVNNTSAIWWWNNISGWEIIGRFRYGDSDGTVNCLAVQGHYLYAGGQFDRWYSNNDPNNDYMDVHDVIRYDFNTGKWEPIGNDILMAFILAAISDLPPGYPSKVTNSSSVTAITVDAAGNIYVGLDTIQLSVINDPNGDGGLSGDGSSVRCPFGILKWNGINWANIGTDKEPAGLQPDTTFYDFDGGISYLATDGTNVFAMGNFAGAWQTNGTFIPSHGIIKWDGTNWVQMGENEVGITQSGSDDTNCYTGIFGTCGIEEMHHDCTIAIAGKDLFVVGPFYYPQTCIARFSTITGDNLPCANLLLNGQIVSVPANGDVPYLSYSLGLVTQNRKIYLGGNFDHVGSVAANSIACWTNDGSVYGAWTDLSSGLTLGGTNYPSGARFLAASTNAVFVGSCSGHNYDPNGHAKCSYDFDSAGGLAIPYTPSIARWMIGPDPSCTPSPSGLVSWWQAESNANDYISGNNGIAQNITYTAGEVGQAFVFNGSSSMIRVPASSSLNVGTNNGFTIEGWINPANPNDVRPILEWNQGNNGLAGTGVQLWLSAGGNNELHANVLDTAGNNHAMGASGVMTANTYQHIALTYDKTTGVAVLYHDGVPVATQNLGSFTPQTSFDLYMGVRPSGPFSNLYFNGKLDEISLYGRALSACEIQAIYNAGSAGKCPPSSPSCTPAPANLISWWQAESNANDYVSGNNGIAQNITYTAGEVGQAFVFNGSSSVIRIPASSSLNVGTNNGFTIEGWINPASPNDVRPILEWNQGNNGLAGTGVQLWLSAGGNNELHANVLDTAGNNHAMGASGVMTANTYQHIALTYDKTTGVAVLYHDGVPVATQNLGSFTPQTSFDLYMGVRPSGPFSNFYLNGKLDEISLYGRALSACEIQAIYNAGNAGKCH